MAVKLLVLALIVGFNFLVATERHDFHQKGEKKEPWKLLNSLNDCSYDFTAKGCVANSKHNRKIYTHLLLSARDRKSSVYSGEVNKINWHTFDKWLPTFLCQCASKLFQYFKYKGKDTDEGVIAANFYGQCWIADINKPHQSPEPNEDAECINTGFHHVLAGDITLNPNNQGCQSFIGTKDGYYLYKVKKGTDQRKCEQYFTKNGCWEVQHQVGTQLLSKEGKLDEEFFCDCAKKAKEKSFPIFSVNIDSCLGWTYESIEKGSYSKYECVTADRKKCLSYKEGCKTRLCVNRPPHDINKDDRAIMLYAVNQGPLACELNPCMRGNCTSPTQEEFKCDCPFGWKGRTCAEEDDVCRVKEKITNLKKALQKGFGYNNE